MEFARAEYIEKLVAKKHNGRIKVITGIRRCGKSYLLFKLFVNYLHQNNVHDNQIVQLALDEIGNAKYRNPIELDAYLRSQIERTSTQYYILIDEIQFVAEIKNPYVNDNTA